jgi:hypothetical protein
MFLNSDFFLVSVQLQWCSICGPAKIKLAEEKCENMLVWLSKMVWTQHFRRMQQSLVKKMIL